MCAALLDQHPNFTGDIEQLERFTALVDTPVHTEARGDALAAWSEYNLLFSAPPGALDAETGLLRKVAKWQDYRSYRKVDLSGASFPWVFCGTVNLGGAILRHADLHDARFKAANFAQADLRGANLSNALLLDASFNGADLRGVDFTNANMDGVDLRHVRMDDKTRLRGATLTRANFSGADLSGADLRDANLGYATLVDANLQDVRMDGCRVYGVSAWDIRGTPASSRDLILTLGNDSPITVDKLNMAQFIYILLSNNDVRDVIDTLTSKTVLILGRFSPERKAVLDALREALRERNYSPILFDFQRPDSKTVTDTVKLLSQMARFVIVDLSDPASSPLEVGILAQANLKTTPLAPIICKGQRPFAMFEDVLLESWCLAVHEYQDTGHLLQTLDAGVIMPAEQRVAELRQRIARA